MIYTRYNLAGYKETQPKEQADSSLLIPNFGCSYLELVRLLKEAAGIEHLLMLQYLYAAFSIKDKYIGVRGYMRSDYYMDNVSYDLLGVAIEEMRHLGMVNEFLSSLGASPNLLPHDFNDVSNIYPFEIKLEPLSLNSVAKYCYIEADSVVLDLNAKVPNRTAADINFIEQINSTLGKTQENHLGSLYATIINYAVKVAADSPLFLQNEHIDWNKFENDMYFIKDQGEEEHFLFFKSVFTASHLGFGSNTVWQNDVGSCDYPSIQFDLNQNTAYIGNKHVIQDSNDQKTAWLSNLHYWVILALLDINYRTMSMKLKYKAIGNMTEALIAIGFFLAEKRIGLPFDLPNIKPNVGKNNLYSIEIIKLMIEEAKDAAVNLKGYLPANFNYGIYDSTIAGLTLEAT